MGIFGIKILSQTKTRMHAHTHTHTQKRNSAFIQFACCIFKFSSVVIFTFARQHLTVMLDDGTAILRCTGTHVYTHMYCVFKELCVWLKCIMWKNIHDMMHKSFIPTEQYVSANQQLSSCFSCFVLFLFFCNPHLFFFVVVIMTSWKFTYLHKNGIGCYILQWFYGYRKQQSLLRQSATYMWRSCPTFRTVRSIT